MDSDARHSGGTGSAVHSHGTRPTVCGCGQELDICHRSHCPRCGATLGASPEDDPHLIAL